MSLCRLLFCFIFFGYCVFASNECVLVVTHEPYAENLITMPNKEGVEIFPGRSIQGSLRPFSEKYGLLLHTAAFYDPPHMERFNHGTTSWNNFVRQNKGKYEAIIFDAESCEYFPGMKTYKSILEIFNPVVAKHAHDNFYKLLASGGVVLVDPNPTHESSIIQYFGSIGLRFEGLMPLSDVKPQYRDILGRLNPLLNVKKRSSVCCFAGKELFVWKFTVGSGFANPLAAKE